MVFSAESKGWLRLAFLGILLATSKAGGQAQPSEDLTSLNIEDLTRIKVYSASRHLEDVRDAPSSVTVITAQEIRHYGWRTLGDALRSLRGFYTSYDRQYSYLGVRGFLRPGDYNSRILVLLNGHRLNENVYDSAPLGTEFPLDLDLIDHIEVVRGPGSSLFGTNAVFGVVNVVTRRPSAESVIEVSGDTSSFFGRAGRLTGMGHKGRWSGLISGSMYRSAGQSELFFPEFASPETNNGYARNMDGMRADTAFADLQYGDVRVQGLFSERGKQYPTASYGTIFNDPADHIEERRAYLDASYHRNISSQTDLDLRVYYDAYNYVGSGAYADSNGRAVGLGEAGADWIGTEANLSRQIGKHQLTVGADYEYSLDIDQRNHLVGQPDLFHSKDASWLSAVYGEIEFHVMPKLTLNAGARLDWFSTFGGAVSPRVALIYSPTPRTSLKYIYGQAFRSPNAYEEYYADDITIERASTRLQPEQIRSQEVVFEHSLKPWLSITGDGYYDQLEKLIDQVPNPSTNLSHFVNAGRVHSKGLEFELEVQKASGLAARASYGLSRAVDDVSHGALANSPTHQAKLNTTFPVLRRGFIGLELLYVSALEDYRGTRVPPFALGNLTFSTRPLWGGWEFSAGCYNALDRKWFSPMGPNDPEAAIQQDGRTLRFKISYRLRLRDTPKQK